MITTLLFDELLLCLYILFSLFTSSYLNWRSRQFRDFLVDSKKNFYFLCNTTIIVLVITLFLLLQLGQNLNDLFPILVHYDFVELNLIHVELMDIPGYPLIRKDIVTNSFSIALTFFVFFYFIVLITSLKRTHPLNRYSLEIPTLILVVCLSLKIFLIATDLIVVVIALELAAFCSVILLSLQIKTLGDNTFSLEAAIKYFVFNAVSVAFLLFATSGYFFLFSSVNFLDIAMLLTFNPMLTFGYFDLLVFFHCVFFFGYLIKIGVAPLHQWVPDVYEGAELLLTTLLVLVFSPVLLFKLFIFIKTLLPFWTSSYFIHWCFVIVGFVSLIIGSFNALLQVRIKRFLAYTGITHLGFILLSFGIASITGFVAAYFYLIFYLLANLVFFALFVISQYLSNVTLLFFNQLKLITNENRFLIFCFLVPLFSYGGFPPFAGFFSKLFAIIALFDLSFLSLLVGLIFIITLSAYLYLRFIKIMIFEKTSFSLFVPLRYLPSSSNRYNTIYYQITNLYKQHYYEQTSAQWLFITIFFLNVFILFFLFFFPLFGTIVLNTLLGLLLFY